MTRFEAWKMACHPQGGWNNIEPFTDSEWGSWYDDDGFHISIQGSDGTGISNWKLTKDWALNFTASPVDIDITYKNNAYTIKCHKGMYIKWESIASQIESEIVKAHKEGCKIFMHHFSQGAGCGYLPALLFSCYLPDIDIEHHLFAPLKTLNGQQGIDHGYIDICDYIFANTNIVVYKCSRDIVPMVPPWFKHYGVVIPLDALHPFYDIYNNHMSYGDCL